MKRFILFLMALAVLGTVAQAETREETKARLEKVSKECAERSDKELADYNPHFLVREKCRRIDSLRDDLTRCAKERRALRIAAWCEHSWEMIGPGAASCPKCRSIAHFLGEQWQVVFVKGMWVGPEPWMYPEEYGLR